MDDFVPERTAAYISQHDLHIGEMTVRETLAFSARCQGVGYCYGMHLLSNHITNIAATFRFIHCLLLIFFFLLLRFAA